MRLAKRGDVPVVVSNSVFLGMGSHFRLLNALYFRAVEGQRLPTEVFPVVEPATAFTGLDTGAVNVLTFMVFSLAILA